MPEPGSTKPPLVVVLAQIEAVEQMIQKLEEMEEATKLRSWSAEIHQEHMLALDNLRALASFLDLYKHGLEGDQELET